MEPGKQEKSKPLFKSVARKREKSQAAQKAEALINKDTFVTLSFKIPRLLHKMLKIKCAENEVEMKTAITSAIIQYIDEQ